MKRFKRGLFRDPALRDFLLQQLPNLIRMIRSTLPRALADVQVSTNRIVVT